MYVHICAYILTHFVWDKEKSRRNLRKHKISFETAKLALEDPLALSVQDRVVEGEQRWQTIGLVAGSVVVLVAHTIEEDDTEDVISDHLGAQNDAA